MDHGGRLDPHQLHRQSRQRLLELSSQGRRSVLIFSHRWSFVHDWFFCSWSPTKTLGDFEPFVEWPCFGLAWTVHAPGLKRTGKSCRLRWLNYLRPDVRRGNITPDEQLLIIELQAKWGNRWVSYLDSAEPRGSSPLSLCLPHHVLFEEIRETLFLTSSSNPFALSGLD